jgi:hypothetical protein
MLSSAEASVDSPPDIRGGCNAARFCHHDLDGPVFKRTGVREIEAFI